MDNFNEDKFIKYLSERDKNSYRNSNETCELKIGDVKVINFPCKNKEFGEDEIKYSLKDYLKAVELVNSIQDKSIKEIDYSDYQE